MRVELIEPDTGRPLVEALLLATPPLLADMEALALLLALADWLAVRVGVGVVLP